MAEEEDVKLCQAKTAEGESCQNVAVFPENDPQYCHLPQHQSMHGVDEDIQSATTKKEKEDDSEQQDEPEQFEVNVEKHVFASDRSNHTIVFEHEGEKIEADFNKGVWQTNDDEIAMAFLQHVNSIGNLRNVVNKVQ